MNVNILHHNSLFLLIMAISLATGLYLGMMRFTTTFIPPDLVPVNYPIESYPIDANKFTGIVNVNTIPGYIHTFIILSKITGLSAEKMTFIPLGSLLLPLGYHIIARRQFRHYYLLVLIIPLYIALDSGLIGYYSIFKYTFTFFLFFLFVSLYLFKWNRERRSLTLVLFLLFVGMTLLHYALAFLTLLILLIFNIGNKLNVGRYRITSNMLLILLVTFIVLKVDVFFAYEELSNKTNLIENIPNLLNRIKTYLMREDVKPTGKYTVFGVNNIESTDKSALFIRGLRTMLIIIPLIVYVILYALQRIIRLNINISSLDLLWSSIIIAGIARLLLYTNIGSPGLINDFVLVLYPFVTLTVLSKTNIRPLFTHLYVIGLVTLSVLSLLLVLDDINYSTKYSSVVYSTQWFLTTLDLDNNIVFRVLGDHRTLGLTFLSGAREAKLASPIYFSDNAYEQLVNVTQPIDFNAAILHIDNKYILSTQWRFYESINMHLHDIDNNPRLNRIYSDSITMYLLTNKFR